MKPRPISIRITSPLGFAINRRAIRTISSGKYIWVSLVFILFRGQSLNRTLVLQLARTASAASGVIFFRSDRSDSANIL